jgi:hypothetical protein
VDKIMMYNGQDKIDKEKEGSSWKGVSNCIISKTNLAEELAKSRLERRVLGRERWEQSRLEVEEQKQS